MEPILSDSRYFGNLKIFSKTPLSLSLSSSREFLDSSLSIELLTEKGGNGKRPRRTDSQPPPRARESGGDGGAESIELCWLLASAVSDALAGVALERELDLDGSTHPGECIMCNPWGMRAGPS